ncbi:MAG: hypothetical protein ACRDHL_06955, partial [Candidatus Promineifilaceae bacterium]
MAISLGGTVHLVWWQSAVESALYYRQRTSGGLWLPEQLLADSGGESDLAVGADGTLHTIAGSYFDGVFYVQRTPGGAWTEPFFLSDPGNFGEPEIALDASSYPHVAWGGTEYEWTYQAVFYARLLAGGSWMPAQQVSSSGSSTFLPQLALDSASVPHLVWTELNSDEIFYRSSATADQSGTSSLSQAVTVPPTLTNPSLSFQYQLNGALPGGDSQLLVQVEEGPTTTPLLALTGSTGSGWATGRADLSPWLGEAITVSFQLEQEAGAPVAWAYLDEVSLGSTYPDLWVTGADAAAVPGEQVTFEISYGNRGGAAASDGLITATLPADLTFVSASQPPISTSPSLVWDVGDLPAGSGPLTIAVTVAIDPAAQPLA